jgi:hypothetical protein
MADENLSATPFARASPAPTRCKSSACRRESNNIFPSEDHLDRSHRYYIAFPSWRSLALPNFFALHRPAKAICLEFTQSGVALQHRQKAAALSNP